MTRLGIAIAAAGALLLSACERAEVADDEVAATAPLAEPAAPLGTPMTEPTSAVCSTYGMIDRDADNRLSRTEYDAFSDTAFADWDADDDNRISEAEYSRCWAAGGFYGGDAGAYNTTFEAFDANNDGYLDENEFFGETAWDAWDANDDNYLTEDEWL